MMLLPPTALKAVSALPSMAAMGNMATIAASGRGRPPQPLPVPNRGLPQPREGHRYGRTRRLAGSHGQRTHGHRPGIEDVEATRQLSRIDQPCSAQFSQEQDHDLMC